MGNLKKGTVEYIEYEKSTEFIIHEMNFYSWKDFLVRAKNLKVLFMASNLLTKQLYLWYIGSREISNKRKRCIWSYLNNDISYKNLTKS